MKFRIIVFLLIAAIYASFVSSYPDGIFSVNLDEHGRVISYYDEYYVVDVFGTIEVYNGYNSTMFEIRIPMNLQYLTFFETGNTNYTVPGFLSFNQFEPHELKSIPYAVRGVTPIDPMRNNMSVLMTAMYNRTPEIYSTLVTRLEKAPIEEVSINTSGIKSVQKRRLVTVIIENPADTTGYNITLVKVIKTSSANLSQEIKRWTYPTDAPYIMLNSYDSWKQDIIDYNCSEGEVYWLSANIDLQVDSLVNGTHDLGRFNQDDLMLINKTLNETEFAENLTAYLEHLVFMKKSYSKTTLVPGDRVEVNIRVNNFAPVNRTINVTDFIPFGFKVISNGSADYIANDTIAWVGRDVNPNSDFPITYVLEYTDEDSLGLDYFEPAVLRYSNETFYSQRISFIRKFIPEKKIFVQKKLRISNDNKDEYVVTIMIQNIGESSINNIRLKEFLGANDPFREISVMPVSRGLWEVPELQKDASWEVSYITGENIALTTLPSILGVPNSVVLKTLIFENSIRTEWLTSNIQTIEYIGVGAIITAPVVLYVLSRRKKVSKERTLRQLGRKIDTLKKDSEPKSGDAIDVLKEETKVNGASDSSSDDSPPKKSFFGFGKYSGDKNKIAAQKNLDELKKTREEVSRKNDNR